MHPGWIAISVTTSHTPQVTNYDGDQSLHEEIRNAARVLANWVGDIRSGQLEPDALLRDPRPK